MLYSYHIEATSKLSPRQINMPMMAATVKTSDILKQKLNT